jgi:uncharacterized membrane protein YgcG
MMKLTPRTIFSSLPLFVLLGLDACTTNEGDTIYQQLGGAPSQGPPGADGKDGKDGNDGKDGDYGLDGRDGRPGNDGVDGTDGKDGKDGKDGAGNGTGGDTGELPDVYPSNLPECDEIVALPDLEIDLFGQDGHLFYFEVTPKMRLSMDNRACDFGGGGPVYELGGEEEGCPPSAFNVRVVAQGGTVCADTGKVELDLPGQSSWRFWREIPNFKLDVSEFQDQKFKTGDKTVRMNNGQADSTIVREATALAIWRAMGYPAPPTRFVKTQSNVWDYDFEPGVFAAHVMVQPYKKAFFAQNLPDVTSVWEGEGNPFGGFTNFECEWSKADNCDDRALKEIVNVVEEAPRGAGFMAATASVIDWPSIHQNQCLSALTNTGDDWIHNGGNNTVIALSKNGKIMYLPYSTDISGGHPWYPDTPYDAPNYYYYGRDQNLAQRCAEDPECRAQALDTCDAMITQFEGLDVVKNIVEERCETLDTLGLKRRADGPVCESLASYYANKPADLREELEDLRNSGGMGGAGGEGGASSGGAFGAGGGFIPGVGGFIK